MKIDLDELKNFINKATLNTYANEKVESRESTDGYKTLHYTEGDWEYEDKYTGYFRSWGSETVKYKGQIIWRSNYGGGVKDKYFGDVDFAKKTFEFLKVVMRNKPQDSDKFFLRGPSQFSNDSYEYKMDSTGDITGFSGNETIRLDGEEIFYHHFMGGLVIHKDYEKTNTSS